jgi:3-phenylpropionate/trans-cinnamate dioxygenase ferredoxin component
MSFEPACTIEEVKLDSALAVEVSGVAVAVVNSAGRYYAIADECSHAAIPLSEGDVGDGEIECYFHGSRFDLRTGRPLGLPATEPVPVYPCRVVGSDVLVDVAAPLDPAAKTQEY